MLRSRIFEINFAILYSGICVDCNIFKQVSLKHDFMFHLLSIIFSLYKEIKKHFNKIF